MGLWRLDAKLDALLGGEEGGDGFVERSQERAVVTYFTQQLTYR